MAADVIRVEREERFEVPREALWSLVTDTDRLNREVGLPPVRFSFLPNEWGGSTMQAETRIAGLTLRYREEPYRWVRPGEFSVRRVFRSGPVAELVLGMRFEPDGPGATRAVAYTDATPMNFVAGPLTRTVAGSAVNGLLGACRSFEAFLRGSAPTAYPRHSARPPADAERLGRAMAALTGRGVDAGLAAHLTELITEAPVEDVVNIRPFALADRWGRARQEVLQACLLGVRARLLELRWRVLCPACRGAGDPFPRLSDMASQEAHCPSCDIRFGPEFDRSVEVCFSVAPEVRPVQTGEATYCIGGPGAAPHVVAQWPLAGEEERVDSLALPPGRYTLRSPQGGSVEIELRDDAPAGDVTVTLRQHERRGRIDLCPGPRLPTRARWRLRSALPGPAAVLRLETPGWMADVATAAQVTSLQAFRDAFGSEVLSPGVDLAVRQIAILFSDLRGSTLLYRTRGDAPSYAAVRDHFQFLRGTLGAHGGGVVKTIGDAVMAAFPDADEALAAALEVQRLAAADSHPFVIKLGLHAGPALAVNANGVLDYFGQTVNLASRFQAQSVGGDVVVAESLAEDPRVTARIAPLRQERFSLSLPGTDEPALLIRLWPQKRDAGGG